MTEAEKAALKKAQDDAKAATEALAKAETEKSTQAARIAELEKAAEPVAKADDKVDLSKADPATRAYIEKMEADRKADRERAEKSEKTANEALAKAQASEDAALTRDFIAKAETFKALPIEAGVFGPVLKSAAAKLTKEENAELERVLKAADAAITETDLFKEQGRARESGKADSAYAEAVQKADKLRENDPKLSKAQAVDKVLSEDRALQDRYLAEQR